MTVPQPGQTLFYLGIPVVLVEDHGDGWVTARWENGKLYRHWAAQLDLTAWGRAPEA